MDKYTKQLELLRANHNYRQLPSAETNALFDLCSNDYLGINFDTKLPHEFMETYNESYKFSATSSRLLSKNLEQHSLLEQLISQSYQSESALVFNSGYHANVGILSALPRKNDLIIADKLIHASVIDGAKLSSADFIRYKHLDYTHLDQLLSKNRSKYDKVFIVSESIFSMDGDIVDIAQLVELKKRHKCFLYIDEAHALGIRGKQGLGCVEEQNCIADVDFIVGTFGKAMASVGAFIACKQIYKDFLINHSRSFIFSTALPPINIAWSIFVFKKILLMHQQREHLKRLSTWFASALNSESGSHIIPFVIGTNADAIAKSEALKAKGFNALPVRYPTVPKGTARLRFSLCANMNTEDLQAVPDFLIPPSNE